jgi:hypothetical protein
MKLVRWFTLGFGRRSRNPMGLQVLGVEHAMVQVIENRADIDGQVVAVKSDAARPGHRVVTIDVGAAAPVEGYPNLFASAPGKQLDIVLPIELAKPLQVGAAVRCRIRLAGPTTVFGERCAAR